jgi:hypothetical protein
MKKKNRLGKVIMAASVLTMSAGLILSFNSEAQEGESGYEWCQFLDRPDRPDIDGCKVAYFNHICICE